MALPRPIPCLAVLACVGILSWPASGADPVAGDSPAPLKREHVTSPHLASVLAESLPKFDPAHSLAAATTPPRDSAADRPANTIVRLPSYIVRAARPPDERDILTQKGREAEAAKRYLGASDGLDRSLNAVTLTDLWRKIPLVGKIPFVPFYSLNNGERALKINERAEEKRPFDELLDLDALAQKLEATETKPEAPKN